MEIIAIKGRELDSLKEAEGGKSSIQIGLDPDLTLDGDQDLQIQIVLTHHLIVISTDRKDYQILTIAIIIIRKIRGIPREIKIMMRLTSAIA